jgi:hypothetical protein
MRQSVDRVEHGQSGPGHAQPDFSQHLPQAGLIDHGPSLSPFLE